MSDQDWNVEAEAMTRHVAEHFPDMTRGAIAGRQSRVSVVFGKETGRDPVAVQDEISRIRDMLEREGIRILGLAQSADDGETWAIIVESEDVELINELLGDLAD
ncbi:MAG: hypothetical protein ACYC61_20600 [Isosphaeraceae bacterium]